MLTGIKTGVIRNGSKRIVGKLKQVCLDRKKGYYKFLFEDGSFLLVKENALFFHTLLRYEDSCLFLEFTNEEILFSLLAYSLYETYGLPLEFTVDESRLFGIRVDEEGFENLKEIGKNRSQNGLKNTEAFSSLNLKGV